MSRDVFNKLHLELKGHPNFQFCRKNEKEREVKVKEHALHLLNYLNAFSDGASNDNSRLWCEKGSGTHENYRNRVIEATIDMVLDKHYYWPDHDKRKDISSQIYKKCGLPNCLGFIHGTLFPLFFKPRRTDSGDYYGRKMGYALCVLVICDHNLCTRCFNAGWPGLTHDDRISRNSDVFKNKDKHFSLIECLLGDSACANKNFILAAHKKPAGGVMSEEHTLFNEMMKLARAHAEHCVGLLKNRFQLLKSLRFFLTEEMESMEKIIKRITACVISHNFLIASNDVGNSYFYNDNNCISEIDADDELNCPANNF